MVDAIQQLVLRSVDCVDRHDAAGFAALFAPDATLVRPNGQPLHGRDAIRTAYEQRPKDRITRHLVTNTLVEQESPGSASARSYVLLWSGATHDKAGQHGRPVTSQALGEFDDRLVADAEGNWLIRERRASFTLHT